ncbi:unnamed protein product [Phaedon cochleariae]|uniref:Uncharacterized protein n=1 Tax=Phaedon cochleariae TaxID=80249 RepID=A0A9P0DH84_PHACE|nr:unnamed protein product [Phaedon cochleariae]
MDKCKCSSVPLILVLILGCATIRNVKSQTSSAIPEIIQSCYRSNFTIISRPPLTMQLLIEIIKKIEVDDRNSVNMRLLVTSMLHGVLFNGIRRTQKVSDDENIIPYRATAEEFYNYKVITDYLIPGQIELFPRDSLSVSQLCLLHSIISSTVDPSERGDESSTCDDRSSMPLEIGELGSITPSSCPLQKGTVKTKWGSISVTHLITAIAAGLQRNPVPFSRVVQGIQKEKEEERTSDPRAAILPIASDAMADAIWVATLAGDMAKAILNQASGTPVIGTAGFWNDTLLPRAFYLKSNAWDLTEAGILAGIDGAILGSHVREWLNILDSIRLSQILDMYYSERGIPFNFGYRANNRSISFNSLLDGVNLTEQIIGSGKLLQAIGRFGVSMADEALEKFAGMASSHLKSVAGEIANKYDRIEYLNGHQMMAPIELIVILDGTFEDYRALQMIHSLSEAIHVSYHGSKLGIINGESGNWMVNVTGEVFQIFKDLNDPKDGWPEKLSLGRSLQTVISYYQNQTYTNCSETKPKPYAQAVLVFSEQGRLSDLDLETSRQSIGTIKAASPAARILYVTPREENSLKRLLQSNDFLLSKLSDDVASIVHEVTSRLSDIPANIVKFYCDGGRAEFEDYITPDVESFYEVHRGYIGRGAVGTKFVNSNYGDLMICAFRSNSVDERICKGLTVNEELSFDSKDFCTPESPCDVRFAVTANSSRIRCAEYDCRYPDQIRMDIKYTYTARGSVFVANILLTISISSVLIVNY